MKLKFRFLSLLLSSLLIFSLVSCTTTTNEKPNTSETDESSNENTASQDIKDYVQYLNDRYHYYLSDTTLNDLYDILNDAPSFDFSSDELIDSYNDVNNTLEENINEVINKLKDLSLEANNTKDELENLINSSNNNN